MTEPDPIAALAAQLEELRGQVARYQAIVTSWNARLEQEGIGGTLMLRHELKQLTQKLDAQITKFGADAQREARAEAETEIREEIKKLGQKLDAAIARRQADEYPAPYWIGLSRDEAVTRVAELREWVEHIARVQWPAYMAKVPPCWPNHGEAVWELSNLATEWHRVYDDEDNRDLQAALWYFERWMPGVLQRLGAALKCDVSRCLAVPSQRPPPRYT